MSKDQIVPVALEFTVRYTKGRTGLFVGFIREFPFITGQAKTFENLSEELSYDLGIYFKAFPEKQQQILSKYGKVLTTGLNIHNENPPALEIERPELGEKWIEKTEKRIMMTTH